MKSLSEVQIKSLIADRWSDFEHLFGLRGACGGCWCMWWRLRSREFEQNKGEKNRVAMKGIVDSGRIPGLLAYIDKTPVGWCSFGRRSEFRRLETSRILKPVDNQDVWSVVCFFIQKKFRNRGISKRLLEAAVGHVRGQDGAIMEGYPVEPTGNRVPDVFAFPGLSGFFRSVGFSEVARRSPTRPIMRLYIHK